MLAPPDVKPFVGYVGTTLHAIRVAYAARQGIIPRITRRLNDVERREMIRSGAVFAFGVEESGIKRWTDGLVWSPSRIVRNFLVYREINQRSTGRGSRRGPHPPEEPAQGASHHDTASSDHSFYDATSHGSTEPGAFKPDGLIKKTITITVDGSDFHLVSYYTLEDIRCGRLESPEVRHDIMALELPLDIFRLTDFRFPPRVEVGPDGRSRLVANAYETEAISGMETFYHPSEDESPLLWPDDPNSPRSSFGGTIQIGLPSIDANHTHQQHEHHSGNRRYEAPDSSSWPSQFDDALRSPSGLSSSPPPLTSGFYGRNDVLRSSLRIGDRAENRRNQRDALALLDDSSSPHESWSLLSPVGASERSGRSNETSNANQTNTDPFIEQQTPWSVGSAFRDVGAQTTIIGRDSTRFGQIGAQHHQLQPHQSQQHGDIATRPHLRDGGTFSGQSLLWPSSVTMSPWQSLSSSSSFFQELDLASDLELHQRGYGLDTETATAHGAHDQYHTHHSPSGIFETQSDEPGYSPFASSENRSRAGGF